VLPVFLLLSAWTTTAAAQYNWKLCKDKDGIKVYESETKNSDFKSIKVECTLQGNYDKFISVMNDVPHYKNWVYRTKKSYLIKRISRDEFYYYTETSLPWPLSNRDAVFHSKTDRDSLNRYLHTKTITEPSLIAEKSGKVRVPYSSIDWYVTMPSVNTIQVIYILQIDPGGYLPAWLVNMFADRGPYESFKQLAEILKK
jgi:hypothetical protein